MKRETWLECQDSTKGGATGPAPQKTEGQELALPAFYKLNWRFIPDQTSFARTTVPNRGRWSTEV